MLQIKNKEEIGSRISCTMEVDVSYVLVASSWNLTDNVCSTMAVKSIETNIRNFVLIKLWIILQIIGFLDNV